MKPSRMAKRTLFLFVLVLAGIAEMQDADAGSAVAVGPYGLETSSQACLGLSDAQIRRELIGCWKSPRLLYKIRCNGIMMRTCPMYPVPTCKSWAVQNGIFYEDGRPYRILAVDDRQFVYQDMYAGTVFILYRVFDPLGSGGVVMCSGSRTQTLWLENIARFRLELIENNGASGSSSMKSPLTNWQDCATKKRSYRC
jgi:hypothetical protein